MMKVYVTRSYRFIACIWIELSLINELIELIIFLNTFSSETNKQEELTKCRRGHTTFSKVTPQVCLKIADIEKKRVF